MDKIIITIINNQKIAEVIQITNMITIINVIIAEIFQEKEVVIEIDRKINEIMYNLIYKVKKQVIFNI